MACDELRLVLGHVGEDVVELRLVLRLGKVVDDAGRERGERLVGGGVESDTRV